QSGRACERVSTVAPAQLTGIESVEQPTLSYECCDGDTTSKSLPDDHHVGFEAFPFERKHLPSATERGLNLVEDQDNVVLPSPRLEAREESIRWEDHAADALIRLDNYGGDIAAASVLDRFI